jgi:hypothetical protein
MILFTRQGFSFRVGAAGGSSAALFAYASSATKLSLIKLRKPPFERSDCVRKIISARCQRPGEHRILYLGAVEYAGLFLFSGDIAVENSHDAGDVGNQYPCLQRFPCWSRTPKMTLVFHFACSKMTQTRSDQREPHEFWEAVARTVPKVGGPKRNGAGSE